MSNLDCKSITIIFHQDVKDNFSFWKTLNQLIMDSIYNRVMPELPMDN
jgi:hypothetical protein